MPVIPSFGTWAPQPQLAQSFLGGARIQQAAQQAAAELGIQKERLGLQKQQFEMEMAAKEKVFQAEQLRRQTELQVESAYKQAALGLRERQMEQEAQLGMSRILQTAAHNQAMQQIGMGRNFVEMEKLGETTRHHEETEATAAARQEALAQGIEPGAAETVEGLPGYKRVRTGPTTYSYLKDQPQIPGNMNITAGQVMDPATGAPIPGMISVPGAGGRLNARALPRPFESQAVKDAKAELKSLEQLHGWLKTGEEPESDKWKKQAPALRKRYAELKAIITSAAPAAATPAPAIPAALTNAPARTNAFRILNVR